MLYTTLKRQKEKHGLTADLRKKIEVFHNAGKLTDEEYNDLMDIQPDEE